MTSDIQYRLPMYERLQPKSAWQASPMAHTDVLSLTEAAALASDHAGKVVTPEAFLRAAARGQVQLMAIAHHNAETAPCRADDAPLGPVPAGAILTLPLDACRQLASAGRAAWRTFDDYEFHNGLLCSFTRWTLAPGEPDFETIADDCRVWGRDVHALADSYSPQQDEMPEQDSGPVPNWKMLVQAEAAAMFKQQRAMGAQPTVYNIVDTMARWCRENDVRTSSGAFPSASYLRVHVLSGKHWKPPE